ncbi:MAG TPA: prolyl oligopeptidase family serine peptidase [Myxococcaceae bacterium]|nr:prolyl oligopeptidase family serine peptidase [Myxococcaceae bacterium]
MPCARTRLALLLLAAAGSALAAEPPLVLTLERIVSRRPALFGTAPAAPTWSPDGKLLAFLWNEKAMPEREIWVVDRDGTRARRLTGARAPGGVSELAWLPGGRLLYLEAGELRRIAANGGQPEVLAPAGGERSNLSVSPDGRTAAWVEDGDLWLLPVAGGKPVRATEFAVKPIGKVGGVYDRPDVELGRAAWDEGLAPAWSADGRFLALQSVDRRHVHAFPIPDYLTPEATLDHVRRGAPGEVNDLRTVAVVEIPTRKPRLLALPEPTRWHIVGLAFSPAGQLLVDRETDDSIDRALHLVDPASGALTEVWTDHRPSRIYNHVASAWHPDGKRILLTGDLDEWYRLYTLTPGSGELQPLTSGPHDVLGPAIAPPGASAIHYVSNDPSPAERQVWRIPAAGGTPTRVSPLPGTNVPFVSPDGTRVAFLHSDDSAPRELYIGPRRITHSPPPEFDRVRWGRVEYRTFPSTTAGVPLHVRIVVPADLDPKRRYPVLFGPVYSNTVRNRWDAHFGGLMQLLVEHGYVLVQVDSRGSTGYGRAFREKFLFEWGRSDLDDYQDAVAGMKSLSFVDPGRIGIFGSSYGGLLTVFSLFKKPGLFQAGVAGAPATDPRYYGSDDVAITRTPATHPEVFDRGRAAPYVAGLRDPLLIIHGMADDVVPFQTSVMLAQALVKAHKRFELAFTPTATHAWTAREDDALYLYGRLVDFFERWIPPGPRDAPTPRPDAGTPAAR